MEVPAVRPLPDPAPIARTVAPLAVRTDLPQAQAVASVAGAAGLRAERSGREQSERRRIATQPLAFDRTDTFLDLASDPSPTEVLVEETPGDLRQRVGAYAPRRESEPQVKTTA